MVVRPTWTAEKPPEMEMNEMGKTRRYHGIDGSESHKRHRWWNNMEADWIVPSKQNNLANVRDAGKAHLKHLGFKTSVRMNHAKVGSSWRRPTKTWTIAWGDE